MVDCAQNIAPLTPLQVAAIAGSISDGDVKKAKASFGDNSTAPFDFTARFKGSLNKGGSSSSKRWERPAVASDVIPQLMTLPVFTAILKSLKIGPDRLRLALASIKALPQTADEKLGAVFNEVAAERATGLKIVEETKGKAGSVSVDSVVTIEPAK